MGVNAKIIAVSYLNTIPFIYGLRHHANLGAELLLAPPASCYQNFVEGKADIALVPAAMVPSLPDAEIITDYCIGAVDKVRTVVVVSNTPIEKVRRIYLDAHSKTSVQLCGFLAKKLWKIEPEWVSMEDYSVLDNGEEGDAYLIRCSTTKANSLLSTTWPKSGARRQRCHLRLPYGLLARGCRTMCATSCRRHSPMVWSISTRLFSRATMRIGSMLTNI